MYYTINSQQNSKVAICLYLYHTDLWQEFKELLLPIRDNIKLYIGLCSDSKIILDFDDFDHELSIHENYGADVAPFLKQLANIKEPIFIKLHSKKSLLGFKYHINWRSVNLNDLIGSKKIFKSNIKKILKNNHNIILCNKHMLFSDRECNNSKYIQKICKIININYETVKNSKFVAGNMFIGRTEFFQSKILPYIAEIDDLLYYEKGKVDDRKHGTFSHAMERIFGYIVTSEDMKFCYPSNSFTKIINTQAPNKKYFKLIKMYNNDCYLDEDINVYGTILETETNSIKIEWTHLDDPHIQEYKLINKNTITKAI